MAKTKLCANYEEYIVGALKRVRDELRDSGIQGNMAISIYENNDITATLTAENDTIVAIQLTEDDDEKLIKYVYGEKKCS